MNKLTTIITTAIFILGTATTLYAHNYKVDHFIPAPERFNGISNSENPMDKVKKTLNNCKAQNKKMVYNDYSQYKNGERVQLGKLECIPSGMPAPEKKE